ncbi:tetratricopeptide repeat protein [Mucilaginibacter gynuensis]|uniref:Tetratricopeptide repeat protein n=1 Tax=Mucilaginibacter gynuensis TaxID=1302236 RepID=A0ABP8HGL7_9SPHI
MFFEQGYYYYIIIGLQAICAFHSYKRGTQSKWIWIIVFLPVVGCLVYIFNEMLPSRRVSAPKVNVGEILNPGSKIKKLEDNLKFTDTFANKIQLADAYLAAKQTEKAIAIYEGSLTGAFADNEHVLSQLMVAYSEQERYPEVIQLAAKIRGSSKFPQSRAHILYAIALEHTGDVATAEKEFRAMKGRYSNFEQRYQYGLFLIRNEREEDAADVFIEILNEVPHLSAVEKKSGRVWFNKVKEELKRITA